MTITEQIAIVRERIDGQQSHENAVVSVSFVRELMAAYEATQANVDAVPVDAIKMVVNEGIDECWQGYQDSDDALDEIRTWLETQVTP